VPANNLLPCAYLWRKCLMAHLPVVQPPKRGASVAPASSQPPNHGTRRTCGAAAEYKTLWRCGVGAAKRGSRGRWRAGSGPDGAHHRPSGFLGQALQAAQDLECTSDAPKAARALCQARPCVRLPGQGCVRSLSATTQSESFLQAGTFTCSKGPY
jgi:hypothetical protein